MLAMTRICGWPAYFFCRPAYSRSLFPHTMSSRQSLFSSRNCSKTKAVLSNSPTPMLPPERRSIFSHLESPSSARASLFDRPWEIPCEQECHTAGSYFLGYPWRSIPHIDREEGIT